MARVSRKKFARRRAPIRRRKVARKGKQQKIHTFKRSVYLPLWLNTATVSDTAFNFNPQLNDLPDYTEFTKLYDQYRITGVSFKLIPRWNVTASSPTGTLPLPPSQIMSCQDFDGNGPTTIQDILQYQNLKVTRGSQVHTRYLKSAVLNMAYETTVSTAYIPKWGQFIDTANSAVPHYGIYGMVPAIGVTYSYDLQATYYLAMRNVK